MVDDLKIQDPYADLLNLPQRCKDCPTRRDYARLAEILQTLDTTLSGNRPQDAMLMYSVIRKTYENVSIINELQREIRSLQNYIEYTISKEK